MAGFRPFPYQLELRQRQQKHQTEHYKRYGSSHRTAAVFRQRLRKGSENIGGNLRQPGRQQRQPDAEEAVGAAEPEKLFH